MGVTIQKPKKKHSTNKNSEDNKKVVELPKSDKLLDQPTRENKVQFNCRVDEAFKLEFQVYCTTQGKARQQGEVLQEIWESYKKRIR